MSQRVLGVDLGAHTVKVVELEFGWRTVRLAGLHTFDVVGGPLNAALLTRSIEALSGYAGSDPGDIVCVGLPGDRVLTRLFDVPFSDPRKVQAVVASELADDIPWEMEHVVFDCVMPKPGGKVIVAAGQKEEIGEVLNALGDLDLDARQLRVAPLSYGSLLRRLYPDETVAVLDVGHLRTNLCIVHEGRPLFARTISRAGYQITETLREQFHLGYQEAERFKCDQAMVVHDTTQLPAEQQHIAVATARALAPLLREVKRTLVAARAHVGAEPVRVLLCGGTSQLAGIAEYLQLELAVAVQPLSVAADPEFAEADLSNEAQAMGALSIGLALEYGRRQNVDFRKGDFALKADTSFLREKAISIAVSVLAVLLFASLSAWASLYSLRTEAEGLNAQLEMASRRVLGVAIADPEMVSRQVKKGARLKGHDIPRETALDIFNYLSRAVPAGDKIKLDINRLDIKAGKTYLRGTTNSRKAVGEVVRGLKAVNCFSEVSAGKISDVGDGKKQFSMTIATSCF